MLQTPQTPSRPTTSAISPGLLRLLNAALIDPAFGELFMESPIAAAHRAAGGAGELLGTKLPDPALRLTLPALSMSEWDILSQMPSTPSLAAAAQELRRLALLAASATPDERAASREVVGDTAAIEPMRMPLLPGVHGAWAPARREGALAGAA
ncbi:MAG TPA: hypothetical protein VFN74_02990 [Chloroflexota bacterium]|nr:hypothetical protein [Chloroflexota bacterium]